MRSNTVIGAVSGLALGLFVDVLIVLLINEWYMIIIWLMAIPIIIGIVLGITLARKLPVLSWWYLVGVVIVGLVLIFAPRAYIHTRIVAMADMLPVYPEAEFVYRSVIEGCSDNDAPWVASHYKVKESAIEVAGYMKNELSQVFEAHELRSDSAYGQEYYSPSKGVRVRVIAAPYTYEDSTFTNLTIHLDVYKYCGKK